MKIRVGTMGIRLPHPPKSPTSRLVRPLSPIYYDPTMRAALPFLALGGALCLPGCGLNSNHSSSPDATGTNTATVKTVPHDDIDLTVSNLTVVRDTARPGAWILTFTVANLGADVTPYTVVPHVGMSYRPIPWVVTTDGDPAISGTIAGLTGNDQTTCTVVLNALPAGAITLDVTVDPDHTIPDTKPANNHASILVTVGDAG